VNLERAAAVEAERSPAHARCTVIPFWLHVLSIASLALGFASALTIAGDEFRHPQQMWIMNLVWPLCGLFAGGLALWAYAAYGRGGGPDGATPPLWVNIGKSAMHCGAGCTLGDICAEWLAVAFPGIAAALGARWFGDRLFAIWVLDYLFAYAFGILFQYVTITPMRGLRLWQGLWAAVKADTLSLTAWQTGMYGFMAFAALFLFPAAFAAHLVTASVEFWFMMQIAMLFGFATSYPVNWWLLRARIKEPM